MAFNTKNPAIKRIYADVRELNRDPSDQYHAAPLEDNPFEWHFTLRGPSGTEFEGGLYHGRILLPSSYPFKPPNIIFNTPNGRFAVGTKICLSISAHHPEYWQNLLLPTSVQSTKPAWGLRLILEALISFFPTEAGGAIGGLDWTPEERRRLAKTSVDWKCYKCGDVRGLVPKERSKGSVQEDDGPNRYADQIKELHMHDAKEAKADNANNSGGGGESVGLSTEVAKVESGNGFGGEASHVETVVNGEPTFGSTLETRSINAEVRSARDPLVGTAPQATGLGGPEAGVVDVKIDVDELTWEESVLTYVTVAILAGIVGILVRKALYALGYLE